MTKKDSSIYTTQGKHIADPAWQRLEDTRLRLMGKWRLVPLFGLEVVGKGSDSIDSPIWDDATLISPQGFNEVVPNLNELDADDLPPIEHRVIPLPQCYIAVLRKKEADATKRARQIASFLTACLFLRGGRSSAVSLHPEAVYWWLKPGQICDSDGQLQISKSVSFCEQIAVRPIQVDISQIRESWSSGQSMSLKPLPGGVPGSTWDIRSDSPLAMALMGKDETTLCQRIRAVADHLTETCAVSVREVQVLMAITAVELLIDSNQFTDLEKVLRFFFQGREQSEAVGRLLKIRHEFVHQGKRPSAADADWAAKKAMGFAWLMVKIASIYAARVAKTHQEFRTIIHTQSKMWEDYERLKNLGLPTDALRDALEKKTIPAISDLWSL